MLVGGRKVAQLVVEGESNAVRCVLQSRDKVRAKLFEMKLVPSAAGAKDVASNAMGLKKSRLSRERLSGPEGLRNGQPFRRGVMTETRILLVVR